MPIFNIGRGCSEEGIDGGKVALMKRLFFVIIETQLQRSLYPWYLNKIII